MPSTHEHIVKSYDAELERLYGEITRMGEIATAQLDAAIDVMIRRDSKAAERVVANDEAIDVLEHEVSQDVLRLLAATAEADDKTRIPLISISLGPLGSVTRMVGGLFGSWLSFAVGESASAPGQIPIGDLVSVYDIIRRARGGEML